MKDDIILVDMGDVRITTDECSIIGTTALATCVGVLVYDRNERKAIVAHVSDSSDNFFEKIIDLMIENKMDNNINEYLVVEGYYKNHYMLYNRINDVFKRYPQLFKPLGYSEIYSNVEYSCNEFAFDAESGNFVTNEMFNYEEEEKKRK